MAGTYSKTIIYSGDANPNGDNYEWIDINGAISQGWITLNPQIEDPNIWDFTILTWSNPGSASSRSAEFKVRHWLWTNDSQVTYWDSFLITQYSDGSVTTTEATTTTEPTTTTSTTTTSTTTTSTTTTATPTYATTWTATPNGVSNATVHVSDNPGSPADNTDDRIATAGVTVTRTFYLHPVSGFEFTNTNQVTATASQGSATVASITGNGHIKVDVSHTTNSSNNNIAVTLNGGASEILPNQISFDQTGFLTADEMVIPPAGGTHSIDFSTWPEETATMVLNASSEDGFGAGTITFVSDLTGTTQVDKPLWISNVSGSVTNGSGTVSFDLLANIEGDAAPDL